MNALLDRIQRKDTSILMIFNSSIKCKILDIFMPIVTYVGSAVFGILFCAISTIYFKTRVFGMEVTGALLISSLVARFIKVHVSRIRPYVTLQNLYIRKIGIDNYSFPSGHTTATFSIAVMIALNIPTLGIFSMLIAITVGVSRMYLGVHYPSDVLVGMLLGTVTSLCIYFSV